MYPTRAACVRLRNRLGSVGSITIMSSADIERSRRSPASVRSVTAPNPLFSCGASRRYSWMLMSLALDTHSYLFCNQSATDAWGGSLFEARGGGLKVIRGKCKRTWSKPRGFAPGSLASGLEVDLRCVLQNLLTIEGQRPSRLFQLIETLLYSIQVSLLVGVELLQLFLRERD